MYDPEITFTDPALLDVWEMGRRQAGQVGFPFYFYVHTSNMRIWDSFGGFPDGFMVKYPDWIAQEQDLLGFMKVQPFAIDP